MLPLASLPSVQAGNCVGEKLCSLTFVPLEMSFFVNGLLVPFRKGGDSFRRGKRRPKLIWPRPTSPKKIEKVN